jgi:hypothetical protein
MIEEGYIALGNVLTDARSLVVDAAQWPAVEAVLKRSRIAYWGFVDFDESEAGAYCVGVSVHAADMPRINELLGWNDGGETYAGDKGQGWRWLGAIVGLLVVAILLGAAALALGVTP